MQGIFIVFEGGEFTGKTTQSRRLVDYLNGVGLDAIWTKEPGGTPEGIKIREKLLHGDVLPEEETDLFCEDRAIHHKEKIRPALERGCAVICDRGESSTIAYQGGGRGQDISEIKRKSGEARGGIRPNKIILLDGDPEKLKVRAETRGEKITNFESLGTAFHNRVRKSFLEQAEEDPDRWYIMNAEKGIEEVWQDVLKCIEPLLPK